VKALCFDGTLKLTDAATPKRMKGESLIRVRMAGICRTDLEIVKGYMGFKGILGHEFVGDVVESDSPELLGKRVVGEINIGCGACRFCLKGLSRHCPGRATLGICGRDGALAEFLTLPDSNLVIVPDGVSDAGAVFTEPLAAALEITEQLHIQPQADALVIGDGKLGLLVAQVLRLTGCRVLLAGRHERKLALFSRLGGRVCKIDDLNPDALFDVTVEASGSPTAWETATRHTAPRGTIVMKSTYVGGLHIDPAPLVVDEITIIGSRCGPFPPALRLLEAGLVEPSPMITAVHPLERGEEAFAHASQRESIKVIVEMSSRR
jgi:threonine dehydrogenase-like Zn-dependent dehydrogenase